MRVCVLQIKYKVAGKKVNWSEPREDMGFYGPGLCCEPGGNMFLSTGRHAKY